DAQNATATEFATEVRYFASLISFIASWNAASSRAAASAWHRVGDVRIKIKRGGDRGMPQPLLHDFWMYVSSQLLCGMAAPDQAGFHRLSWRGPRPMKTVRQRWPARTSFRDTPTAAQGRAPASILCGCAYCWRGIRASRAGSTRRRLDAFTAAQ